MGEDDYPDIGLAVAQGTSPWQPVKFGGSRSVVRRMNVESG